MYYEKMVKTNCSGCGLEIETKVCNNTPEGHMCIDCELDYLILTKGIGCAYV